MKDYTIYLAPDCHECDFICNYLMEHNIPVRTELLDNEASIKKGLFIFPALTKKEEIVAYGKDILKYLPH